MGQLGEIGLRYSNKDAPFPESLLPREQICKEFLEEAIRLGNLRAHMELGISKLSDFDHPTSDVNAEGVADIREAATQGYNGARCCLFLLFYKKTIQDGLEAARQGSLLALVCLGEVYRQRIFEEDRPILIGTIFHSSLDQHREMLRILSIIQENIRKKELSKNCEALFTVASEYGEWRSTLSLQGFSIDKDKESYWKPDDNLKIMRVYHKAFEQQNGHLILGEELGEAPSFARMERWDIMERELLNNEDAERESTNQSLNFILNNAYQKFTSHGKHMIRLYKPWQTQRNENFEICYHAAMVLGLTARDQESSNKAKKILVDLAKKMPDEFVKLIVNESNWWMRVKPLLGEGLGEEILRKGILSSPDVLKNKIYDITGLPSDIARIIQEYLFPNTPKP